MVSAAEDIVDAVRRIQVDTMIRRAFPTILTNALLSICAFGMTMMREHDKHIARYWIIAVFATLLLRLVLIRSIRASDVDVEDPSAALRLLTMGAGLSGLVWAILPFSLVQFNAYGLDAALYLMMLGVSTGSVLMGVGYRWIPIAFSLPLHLSVAFSLLAHGGTTGLLLAVNVFGLALILYRSCQTSEKIYLECITNRLETTAATVSLSAANSDILQANARLERLARCDSLTGLANRAAFNDELREGIADSIEGDRKLALLVIDLDRFKHVNDTMGHKVGDDLLAEFGLRLRNTLPAEHTFIARLGGDEFSVIITGADAAGEATRVAEVILRQGRRPFTLDGQTCTVGTSVGVAIFPDHAATADELFVAADMALYRSKDQGRGRWRRFDPQLRAAAERQRQIEADLPGAIERGEIEAWFQPQVALVDQQLTGFEALVRWHHPSLGFIAPPEIVQAAHAVHLSDRLTGTIADAACRLLNALPALGLAEATVAVNVSPREFALYSVADLLDETVARHGVRPPLLEIEITEEVLLDTAIAGEQLKRLERSGFPLAVDDFGAGHSSLTRLIDLKVDRLKIDRGLTEGLSGNSRSQAIITALIRLGEALSMDMLAEGVETETDARTLLRLGCRLGQGYHFARPMPVERIPSWLAERAERMARRTVA